MQHEFVVGGFGTWKQADYVTAALADDGSVGVAYLPGTRKISINLAKLSGRVTASWFDPTNGQSRPVEGSPFDNDNKHEFTPPNNNAAGEGDFVLVLKVR